MASLLLDIAGKILDPIVDIVVGKVVRHVHYIFRYKKNIKELEVEKKNLEKIMEENEEKVEAVKIRNNIVEKKVEEWKQKAEDKKHEVENLMIDKVSDENVKCLKFFCPNLCSRYRMSKEAAQKKGDIERHIQCGNFQVVAHSRPPPQGILTGNFMDFDSRKPLLKLIKDKLKSGDPKYNMIGVHGVGGIGKTTTVELVCKQLKEECVFYDAVKGVVSQDVNVRKIQGELADQLDLRLVSETEAGRRGELLNRLNNGKNNLVILDDLWGEVKLTDIGIPLREGGKGCKVVLTTRDRQVLTDMEVGEYIPVEVLSKEEAWSLFEKKVGVTLDSVELRIAQSVCEECRGLPVAILAVGGALARKTETRIWKAVLGQLQNSSWENIDGINGKMYASLKCSYDCLDTEEKSILLLCCLYPEDDNIQVDFLLFHCIARRILPDQNTVDEARNQISYLVRSLKDRSLLSDGKDKDHVKMHDVIRDVVISIAKIDEQYLVKNATDYWPVESINENMAAISVCLNKLKGVPNEPVCPRLHTLRIECKDYSFQFPDNFFSGAGEIRVLELKRIRMSSTPSSLANLSKLRTLILIDCMLEDMSFLKGLNSNLEVLVIVDFYMQALPMELGELSHLRVLLLNKCNQLKLIPAGVISKLTNLEELCFPDQFNFYEEFSGRESEDIEISRATLSGLSSLTRLTNLCVFIPNVRLVPDLNFGNLVSYQIALGDHFYEYRKYFKQRYLKLVNITYHDKIVALLERAEVLFLYRVKRLENVLLNKGGEGFLELVHFVIKDCDDLEQLLGTPHRYTRNQGLYQSNSFSKLTTLEVSNCSFKFLFTSSRAKGLQQLRRLDISRCDILEEIVGTEGEKDEDHFDDRVHFSKLKELQLWNLPKLKSFGPKTKENATIEGDSLPKGQSLFNEKVIFPILEQLKIWSLPNITEIWDKQVLPTKSFPHLADVEVYDCEKLVTVFSSILWAESLRKVYVRDCKGVTVIVSITGLEESEDANNCSLIFHRLRVVWLFNLGNLNAFCSNSNGSKPQSLFDARVHFPALERIVLKNLPNMEIFKQMLSTEKVKFPALRHLRIGDEERYTILE